MIKFTGKSKFVWYIILRKRGGLLLRRILNIHLTRRYLVALGFIAVLSTSAYTVTHDLIRTQATNAAVINISGRQRMLSQKAVLLSQELVHSIGTSSQQKIQLELVETANLIEKSHNGLIKGDPVMNLPGSPTDEIRSTYFSEPVLLDQRVKNFVRELRALAKPGSPSSTDQHLEYILNEGKSNLLNSFEFSGQTISKRKRGGS